MSTETVVSYKIEIQDKDDNNVWRTAILDRRALRTEEDAKEWAASYRRDGLRVRIVRKETVMTTTVTVVDETDPWADAPLGERYEESAFRGPVRYVVGKDGDVWCKSPYTGERWHAIEADLRTYIEQQSYVER